MSDFKKLMNELTSQKPKQDEWIHDADQHLISPNEFTKAYFEFCKKAGIQMSPDVFVNGAVRVDMNICNPEYPFFMTKINGYRLHHTKVSMITALYDDLDHDAKKSLVAELIKRV